jgi:hypothetical protein
MGNIVSYCSAFVASALFLVANFIFHRMVSEIDKASADSKKLRHEFLLQGMVSEVVKRHRAQFPDSPLGRKLRRYLFAGATLGLFAMLNFLLSPG